MHAWRLWLQHMRDRRRGGPGGGEAGLGRHFYQACYEAVKSNMTNAVAGSGALAPGAAVMLPANTAAGVAGSPGLLQLSSSGSGGSGARPRLARRDGGAHHSSPGGYLEVVRTAGGGGGSGAALHPSGSGNAAGLTAAASASASAMVSGSSQDNGSLDGVLHAVMALQAGSRAAGR
jgi:hypothetical protein